VCNLNKHYQSIENMEEQIINLTKLYSNGINLELFNKLILHSTDGNSQRESAYQNDLDVESWKKLYSKDYVEIPISSEQLVLFFEYMCKYHNTYCRKNRDNYAILKTLYNDRKANRLFNFEEIVFTVIQL
jgi:hypothetical protein